MSALLTQLPWTRNLLILTQSKHPQREFYLRLAVQEKWSTCELERQRLLNKPLIPISHKHRTLRDMACERLPV